jgi:amino acid transporter
MANLKERFFALCTPAQVYLVLALFSGIISIFSANDGVIKTLIWLLFVILWTLVLNFLCSKGLSGVSWALVLLPYIVILFTLVFITSGIFSGKIRVKK